LTVEQRRRAGLARRDRPHPPSDPTVFGKIQGIGRAVIMADDTQQAYQVGPVAYRSGPTANGPQPSNYTAGLSKQLSGNPNADWPMAVIPEAVKPAETSIKS
jgi:hypothetical protein